MMGRIIDVSTPSSRLRVRQSQLVISIPDNQERNVPIEDIGVLILNDPSITMSQSVLVELAKSKAAVINCGTNQMPIALTLPLAGHTTHALRLRNQINASQPLKKRLWQSIIKCKIQR